MGTDNKSSDRKKSKGNNILLIVAIVLLVSGLLLLLVDPIKNKLRQKKIDEGMELIEDYISSPEPSGQMTFVVPVRGNEVEGESIDYLGNDNMGSAPDVDSELAAMGENVTLNGIGILEIKSIDLRLPLWDTATIVSLRYGAGHFEDSVMPGQSGNCAILGHHFRDYGSMFNRLGEVEINDIISVQCVDGKIYYYVVDDIRVINPDDLLTYISGDYSTEPRITLVTCTYTATDTLRLLVMGHLVENPEQYQNG